MRNLIRRLLGLDFQVIVPYRPITAVKLED